MHDAGIEILDAALEYTELGYSVIPLIRGMKKPPKGVTWVNRRFNSPAECSDEVWKRDHPDVEWGKADKEQIRQWWKEHPNANIGILTGAISGVDAIDEDGPHAHETLVEQSGVELPETVTSITGRTDGGKQRIFKYHGGGLKNTARFCSNGNGSQCDIRTDGGLIVVHPSIHESGKKYEWEVDPRIEDPEPFPPELISFIHERQNSGNTTGRNAKVDYDEYFRNGISDGDKHHGLFKFACKRISQGLQYPEVLLLTTEAARHCSPLPKDGPEHAAKVRVDEAWAKHGHEAGFDNLDEIPADTAQDKIQELNKKHAVIWVGGKCVVLNQTIDPVFNRPDISFSSKGDFLNMYANRKIKNPDAPTKQIPIGKLWWESSDRKQYDGLVFEPQKDFDGYYNLWRGFSVEPKKGDWSLMKKLIRDAISSGNEARYQYLRAWLARIVQDPGGQRPGVAFVMRGRQGVGKGKFATEFGSLLSSHFLQVAQAGQVTGRFNTHLKDCVALFVDEGFWAGDKQAESVIKNLVTEPTITVEPKGKDLFKVKNNVNIIIASNADWVVPAGLEERRFFTVDVDDCFKGNYDFFRKLTAQMDNGGREAMLYDLQKMDISGVNLRDFERTDALLDQILESMTLVQKWWFAQLRRGAIRMVDYGGEFGPRRDEWPTSASNEQLYDSFEMFVAKIHGYLPVPEVFGRQLSKLITPVEIIRPRTPDGAPRRRLRVIPELTKCREVFEKKLEMKVDWEDEKHEIPPF